MQFLTSRKILAVLAAMTLLSASPCIAQEDSQLQLSSQKIKAGLIYNFLKYTNWPAEKMPAAPSPLIVCIFGSEDPFSGYLEPIEERTVHERPVKLRHISTVEESAQCNMLYVGNDTASQWPALHAFLAAQSVLTVGDFSGFSQAGGMIEFSTDENRIQIWLNTQAVNDAHLHIYDNLRRLAKLTHPSRAGGAE